MRKIQVGLLGLGTVGMGVYKLLRKRAMEKLFTCTYYGTEVDF